MAKGLNKVMLIGHLGNDPELRTTSSGQSVANFTLATNENFKDSNGNLQERTEWHRIITWGKLAEICNQYLKKGRQVYIEGRLQTRSWDDAKSGEKKYTTEIVCSDMQMLGGQRDQGSGQGSYEGTQNYDRPQINPVQHDYPQGNTSQTSPSSASMLENEKDDLPF
ncbi:MAG: single-stranded DNA-binding protein [Chlorobium sp.]|nr:MAG: single-stranded DNA-binding protein [Chlorobium sp.]